MSMLPIHSYDGRQRNNEAVDGIALERRRLLWVSIGTLAALAVNSWQSAAAQHISQPRAALDWDELVGRTIPLAEELIHNGHPDEETYLIRVSALMRRLRVPPKAFFNFTRPVSSFETLRRFPLLVLQFRLAPNATIPCHDHRDYNGILTVTEGSIRVRSFEILGSDTPTAHGSAFHVQETHNSILTNGGQSILSRTRDNIHNLKAGPEGARFIDFFTLFREDAHSVYLNVAEEPLDSSQRIFAATWA